MQISSKADHETIQIGLSLKRTTISVRLAGYFVGAEWLTKWIVLNLLEITGKPPRLFDNPQYVFGQIVTKS